MKSLPSGYGLAITAVAFAASLLPGLASAETARGCRGELHIFDRSRADRGKQDQLLASFEGRGTCKNKFHANDCRKRAADGIIRCSREMWSTRNTGALPASCTLERGNSFAHATLEGINPPFFRPQNVLDRARFAACCVFNRNDQDVVTNLEVVVIGGTGCISKHSLTNFDEQGGSWHSVDQQAIFHCKAVRDSGMCGPSQ